MKFYDAMKVLILLAMTSALLAFVTLYEGFVTGDLDFQKAVRALPGLGMLISGLLTGLVTFLLILRDGLDGRAIDIALPQNSIAFGAFLLIMGARVAMPAPFLMVIMAVAAVMIANGLISNLRFFKSVGEVGGLAVPAFLMTINAALVMLKSDDPTIFNLMGVVVLAFVFAAFSFAYLLRINRLLGDREMLESLQASN